MVIPNLILHLQMKFFEIWIENGDEILTVHFFNYKNILTWLVVKGKQDARSYI